MAQSSILETAAWCDVVDAANHAEQSDWRRGLLHTRVVDARIRRRFVLRFGPMSRGQRRELRDHYRANAHKDFAFTMPAGGAAVRAIYLRGPQMVAARTGQWAAAVVELEEALAAD